MLPVLPPLVADGRAVALCNASKAQLMTAFRRTLRVIRDSGHADDAGEWWPKDIPAVQYASRRQIYDLLLCCYAHYRQLPTLMLVDADALAGERRRFDITDDVRDELYALICKATGYPVLQMTNRYKELPILSTLTEQKTTARRKVERGATGKMPARRRRPTSMRRLATMTECFVLVPDVSCADNVDNDDARDELMSPASTSSDYFDDDFYEFSSDMTPVAQRCRRCHTVINSRREYMVHMVQCGAKCKSKNSHSRHKNSQNQTYTVDEQLMSLLSLNLMPAHVRSEPGLELTACGERSATTASVAERTRIDVTSAVGRELLKDETYEPNEASWDKLFSNSTSVWRNNVDKCGKSSKPAMMSTTTTPSPPHADSPAPTIRSRLRPRSRQHRLPLYDIQLPMSMSAIYAAIDDVERRGAQRARLDAVVALMPDVVVRLERLPPPELQRTAIALPTPKPDVVPITRRMIVRTVGRLSASSAPAKMPLSVAIDNVKVVVPRVPAAAVKTETSRKRPTTKSASVCLKRSRQSSANQQKATERA